MYEHRAPEFVVSDAFPQSSPLLLALQAFEQVTSRDENDPALLQVSLHSLRVVSRMLRSAWDHPTTASHLMISTLGQVLQHIMTTLFLSKNVLQQVDVVELSFVDKIFECLIDDIFGPVIRAFRFISSGLLSDLLEDINRSSRSGDNIGGCTTHGEMKRPHVSDLRRDLLSMFGTLVNGLCSDIVTLESSQVLATPLSNLRALLVLEVVRELEYVLFATSYLGRSDDDETSGPSYHGMERLIAKDTLWYLCAMMHILAGLSIRDEVKSQPMNDSGRLFSGLVQDKIVCKLYDLVLKCQTRQGDSNDSHKEAWVVSRDGAECRRGLPLAAATGGRASARFEGKRKEASKDPGKLYRWLYRILIEMRRRVFD